MHRGVRRGMMDMWLCLTPNMLNAIASCSGNVYFIDAARCSVKMNGMMVRIQRIGNDWFASSSSPQFYNVVVRHISRPSKRGTVIRMNETQMFGVIAYICKINAEEGK